MKVSTALLLGVAASTLALSPAAAQRGRAWLLGDVGAALAGGGSYTGNVGFFANGGIGVALSSTLGVEALASYLYTSPKDCTAIILGQCGRGFPETSGATLGIVSNDNGLGEPHSGAAAAGVGAFRTRTLTGRETTTGGLYFGGEGTLLAGGYGSLDVGGRVIVLPRVNKQTLFIFPFTIGFRFW